MRNLFTFEGGLRGLFLLILIIVVWSCEQSDDSPKLSKGTITFSPKISTKGGAGGRVSGVNTPASLTISIVEAGSKKAVLSHYSMALSSFGNTYATEPLSLTQGEYEVTEFLIMNSSSEVIHAIPAKNSIKASLVSNPLPITLSVTGNESTSFEPEVVPVTDNSTPEQFGMASFGFTITSKPTLTIQASTSGLTNATVRAFIVNTTDYSRQWINLINGNNLAEVDIALDPGYYQIEINYEVDYSGGASVNKKTLKAEEVIYMDGESNHTVSFASPAQNGPLYTEWFKVAGPSCSFELYVPVVPCSNLYKLNICSGLSSGYFSFGKDFFPNGSPGIGSSSFETLYIGDDISDDAITAGMMNLDAPPISITELTRKLNTGIVNGVFNVGSDDSANCSVAVTNPSGKINFSMQDAEYLVNGILESSGVQVITFK